MNPLCPKAGTGTSAEVDAPAEEVLPLANGVAKDLLVLGVAKPMLLEALLPLAGLNGIVGGGAMTCPEALASPDDGPAWLTENMGLIWLTLRRSSTLRTFCRWESSNVSGRSGDCGTCFRLRLSGGGAYGDAGNEPDDAPPSPRLGVSGLFISGGVFLVPGIRRFRPLAPEMLRPESKMDDAELVAAGASLASCGLRPAGAEAEEDEVELPLDLR